MNAQPEAETAPRNKPPEAAPANAEPRARQPEAVAQAGQKASAEPAPATPSDAELLRAVARQNWERILEPTKLRASPLIKAALQTVRQLEASGGTLVLLFEHESARGQVDRADNKQKVESLMEEVVSRPVHIRCTLVDAKTGQANRPAAARPAVDKGGSDDEAFLREARNLGAVVKRLDK